MEFFQDDLYPPTRDTSVPVLTADEWFGGKSKEPATLNLQPQGNKELIQIEFVGMEPLSQAPVEKKVKKYDFKTERAKDDSNFSKDKVCGTSIYLMDFSSFQVITTT
jgi:hypothetical protein